MDEKTHISRKGKNYVVSTVLIGGDLNIASAYMSLGGPYETMVFACDANGLVTSYQELYFDRYKTEAAARAGHAKAIAEFNPK